MAKIVGGLVLFFWSIASQSAQITDTVTVGAREWAQVSLFNNLSWVEATAQCPAGICGAGSSLNGYEMNGWKFASAVDVDGLFNTLTNGAYPLCGSGGCALSEVDSAWAPAIVGVGGLFTANEVYTGVRRVNGWVRDGVFGSTARFAFVVDSTSTDNAGTQGSGVYNFTNPGFGGWFYRDVTTVPKADFTLKSSSVTGCKSVVGTVKLDVPAPAGGVLFTLSDTLTAATMPATVTVPEGALSKTFTVKTIAVETAESGTVSATLGSQTLNQDLTLKPIGMKSVTLTPTSVVGGTQVVGKANLECKAGPGPILVDLASSNAAVASPIAASISVEQGMLSANFDVTTNTVQATSFATISGTANGVNKSKKLTVNVAATVSPTSLKFGSVAVGTTHVLNATLTNKGAEAFAVSSISPTGSNATYYSQTNNCPANLAAGASCTIEVSFNPTVAGSKSAKLSIATSATSTPLSLSLSGTGI